MCTLSAGLRNMWIGERECQQADQSDMTPPSTPSASHQLSPHLFNDAALLSLPDRVVDVHPLQVYSVKVTGRLDVLGGGRVAVGRTSSGLLQAVCIGAEREREWVRMRLVCQSERATD